MQRPGQDGRSSRLRAWAADLPRTGSLRGTKGEKAVCIWRQNQETGSREEKPFGVTPGRLLFDGVFLDILGVSSGVRGVCTGILTCRSFRSLLSPCCDGLWSSGSS